MPEVPSGLVDSAAETAVVSALLASPDVFLDVSELLHEEDFAGRAHAAVFAAVVAADAAGRPVDVVTVAEELRRADRLDLVGGVPALRDLAARAVLEESVVAHAQIVAERARLRRIIASGRSIAAFASEPERLADEALEHAESEVLRLGARSGRTSLVGMTQAVPLMLADLARARTSVLVGHSTGFEGLDRMTGGLQGGQLVILAARPGVGKSALAAQLARHIAETSGLLVPLLSYEMSTSEIAMRMLSSALRFDLLRLRRGDVPDGMERDLADHAQRLASLSVMIDDNPPETIGGVRSHLRRLARRGQVGAVVVDYLQLMGGDSRLRSENRTQEVSEISRGLKRLASELDVPVIALSQLNRSLEQRPNKRPNLSDLRESGSLEQDASLVLFVYREHLYDASADPADAELIVAKQRNGPVGSLPLRFDPSCARFSDGPPRPSVPAVQQRGARSFRSSTPF